MPGPEFFFDRAGERLGSLRGFAWTAWASLIFLTVFVIMLPYGPAAVEVSVGGLFVIWLLQRFTDTGRHSKEPPLPGGLRALDAALLIMAVLWIFTAFMSPQPWPSLKAVVFKSLEWGVIFFVFRRFLRHPWMRFWLMGCLTATLWVTLVDALVQWFHGKDLFRGHALIDGSRVSAGFKHPNDLAAFLAVLTPWLLSRLMTTTPRNMIRRWFWIGTVVLWLIVFFLTFSRGAWAAALIGSVIYVLGVSSSWKRIRTIGSVGGLFFVSLFLVCYPTVQKTFEQRRDSVWFRLDVFEDGVEMLRQRLWTGWGPGRFMDVYQSFQIQRYGRIKYQPTYAHNCYLQIAVETGLVGLMGFLGFLIVLFRGIRRDALAVRRLGPRMVSGQNPIGGSWVWACALIIFLIHAGVDTHFFGLQLNALFGFLLALWWSYHTMDASTVQEA